MAFDSVEQKCRGLNGKEGQVCGYIGQRWVAGKTTTTAQVTRKFGLSQRRALIILTGLERKGRIEPKI